MDKELSFDNILDDDAVASMFGSYVDDDDTQHESNGADESESNEEEDEPAEVDIEGYFESQSESVGSEEDNEETDEDADKGGSSSPNNFYSSIAAALSEDGILEGLEFNPKEVTSAEDFAELIQKTVDNRLEITQKRINDALKADVEPSVIRQYEETLNFLDSLDEEKVSENSEDGENLRKNLIYRDLINRGYKHEQAVQKVQRSINAGTDAEDAIEALASNKEFFTKAYNDVIEENKNAKKKAADDEKARLENLKKSILEDEKFYGDIAVDSNTRRKVYDNIAKATYKDPKTGNLLTEVQKYQLNNPDEFIKNVGLLYTLTDGFKSLDKLIQPQVDKKVKKGLRRLENTINSSSRDSDGNLKFVRHNNDDSYFGKGWSLDLSK